MRQKNSHTNPQPTSSGRKSTPSGTLPGDQKTKFLKGKISSVVARQSLAQETRQEAAADLADSDSDEEDPWEGFGEGEDLEIPTETHIIEVDIMKFAKPARPKKSKAGDFEMLPTVQRVFVLEEDIDDRFVVDTEDDWECLDNVDGDWKDTRQSYAQIVKQ